VSRLPYVLAAISGLILFLVFPNSIGINLWPLAWVAIAPLIAGLEAAKTKKQAALIAATCGLAGYPVFYHWLVSCMHTYAKIPYPVAILVLLAMVAVLAAFLAGFGAAYHALGKTIGLSPIIAAPIAWTAFEFLRGHFPFGGFPWALIAYSQAEFPPIIQIAEVTGPYGIGFAIIITNAAAAKLAIDFMGNPWSSEPRQSVSSSSTTFRKSLPLNLIALIAPPLLLLAYGAIRMPMVDRAFDEEPEITLGVVQGNIEQDVKWDMAFRVASMRTHLELTTETMKSAPDMVIWPEAAFTWGAFNRHWEGRTPPIQDLATIDTYLLIGALRVEESDEPPGKGRRLYNSAYLLTPRARSMAGRYDKMHLVPFGEYVPLAKLLFFADAIAQGNTGSTTPGETFTVMSGPGAYFGCVICYEVIFPELVRKFKKQGAGYMTTITNDAWFGKTGAPYQHHANVVFRAVENRVYFARSANTGVSSIVDPNGRVVQQTEIFTKAAFTGTVKPSPMGTVYDAVGDVFAWINALAFIGLLAWAWHRGRQRAGA